MKDAEFQKDLAEVFESGVIRRTFDRETRALTIEPVSGHTPKIEQPQNPFYLDIYCSCGGFVYVFKGHAETWWRRHTDERAVSAADGDQD